MLICISSGGELDFLLGTDIIESLFDVDIWFCWKLIFGRILVPVVSFLDLLSSLDSLDKLILGHLSVNNFFLFISEHFSPADL